MNILLSYSKYHYHPAKPLNKNELWGSSASVIAKNIYDILSTFGKVKYIDCNESHLIGEERFDLFVGIHTNFAKIVRKHHIKKSILIAVNEHPRERNKRILLYTIKNLISPKSMVGYDLVNRKEVENAIKISNHIIVLGNDNVYNSYLKNGVPHSKIRSIDYEPIRKNVPLKNFNKKNKQYVYVVSEIGLRKGFDIIFNIFTNRLIAESNFTLHIIGKPTNNLYKEKLEKLKLILQKKLILHDWIDSNSLEYHKILATSDFVILPSVEEGQAGTLVEAIQYGTIPIVSNYCGINFSPLGNLELKTSSPHNIDIINSSLSLNTKSLKKYSNHTKDYFNLFHKGFKSKLSSYLSEFIGDSPKPLVSIILSVFNKEKTITQLLNLLIEACQKYGNTEIHIIIDGCKDKTEIKIKEFFRKHPKQKVTYQITDNIFEIKSNNIGLKKSKGKYCAIIQDDNYIYEDNFITEVINFLERSKKIAVFGGLAGVNFYPIGTKLPSGSGQQAMTKSEVYWRQDNNTDSSFSESFTEVDACMRGPLFIRKEFLKKHGYLDEIFAPLYQDDMDLCFRAKSLGHKVFFTPLDVVNHSETMINYDSKKWQEFEKIISRNTKIFYNRWRPTSDKNYLRINRYKPSHCNRLQAKMRKLKNHKNYYFSRTKYSVIKKISLIKNRIDEATPTTLRSGFRLFRH